MAGRFIGLFLVALRGQFDIRFGGGLWPCYDDDFDEGYTIYNSRCGERVFFGNVLNRMGQEFVGAEIEPFPPDDLNVFYVGNSYTGYNQLAELTVGVFERDGVNAEASFLAGEDLASMVRMIHGGEGNYFFNGGELLAHFLMSSGDDALAAHRWKWIILQNISHQAGFWRSKNQELRDTFDESLEAAQTLNSLIIDSQPEAETIFMMTWGRMDLFEDYPDLYTDFLTSQNLITEGYLRYVEATSTPERPTYCAPVGLVYQSIYLEEKLAGIEEPHKADSGSLFYQLYENGGDHESLAGSYIIALTVYATITGNDAKLVTWKPPTRIMDEAMAERCRDAVSRTIKVTAEKGIIRYPWQDKDGQ
ncbi:expressed unknown protein [Seminavis robusta]|uniref:Uncharacterized protein n=1 Tax=Seminavis robusta TaxID=568900 RepID=A0A9N8DMW8_9STRA|nr:expressed unknown protein [Seminavis robusta]|eukprot:Sro249_g098600.1 n/a (362) ;mRNA; r:16401-17588